MLQETCSRYRKIVVVFFTFVLVFILVPSSLAEKSSTDKTTSDFKSYSWGAKKEDVIATEGTPDYTGEMSTEDAEYIGYKTTAVGLDAILAYYFCDNGLYASRYILTEDHSNEDLYIDDYNTLKNALIKKYGSTLFDGENWSSDDEKEYYANKKGRALNFGYLSYYTYFFTERTTISLDMSADNYEISTTLQYSSTAIEPGAKDFSGEI